MSVPAGFRFIAWSRRGLSAAASVELAGDGRVRLPVTVTVRKGASDTEDVTRTLELYGPGDVVRLDERQVIRREPRPGTADFEPNYFPLIEFDAPELPWMLSPEVGDTRLRPWLVLVVVPREIATIRVDALRPLPWLSMAPADASAELPNLDEAWAWAHVQIAGSTASDRDALDGRQPELTLSRVISPRRLQSQRAYRACLVPAYRAGVQAGLGEPVAAGAALAWPPAGGWGSLSGPFELPVYDHWEFATAEAGDFESLVRRLRPHAIGPDIGALPLDIGDPSPDFDGLGLEQPTWLPLEGALTSPELPARAWPDGVEAPFTEVLETLMEIPPGVDATVVRPPIYGGIQGGSPEALPEPGQGPPWLRELNLDPGWRVAAALGTHVVQELQEQLMASAWDQAGELEQANALLRQAQLARATASAARDKHLDGLPPDSVVRLSEPVHSRVRLNPNGTPPPPATRRTLRGSVKESVFPQAVLSPPFRRVVRPDGPVGRRLPGAPQEITRELSEGLARGEVRVPVRPPRGGAEFDDVGARAAPGGGPQPRFSQLGEHLQQGAGWQKVAAEDPAEGGFYVGEDPYAPPEEPAPEPPAARLAAALLPIDGWEIEEIGVRAHRLVGINTRFRQATAFLLDRLPAPVEPLAAPEPELALETVADALIRRGGALEPDDTVARLVVGLVPPSESAATVDPLQPRAATLRFPQPMSSPLATTDGEMLLPGIDRVAADSIGVLVGNARFIEAYMAGLNHELSRELLWRGVPADLAATFADRFWDVRGQVGQPPESQIPAIAGWTGALGANAAGVGGGDMLVLLVRGRLLFRYPHTAVYAARAVPRMDATGAPVSGPDGRPIPAPGQEERYPLFRGTIAPDVTYLGFDLTIDEARGGDDDLGWFFVIQEQPTAPRFGLDEPADGSDPALSSWSDLDWADVVPPGTDLGEVRYTPIAGPLAEQPLTLPVLSGRALPTATWGVDSAQMAAVTYQRPMRVAIHARTALPATGATS